MDFNDWINIMSEYVIPLELQPSLGDGTVNCFCKMNPEIAQK